MTDPNLATSNQHVPQITKFQNRMEDGRIVASHPTIKVEHVDTKKYYICTVPNASMHNFDGKKIPFVGGFLATDLKGDIAYLDDEIESGNLYIRHATEEEALSYNLRTDPRGTIRAELTDEVRNELEASLRVELEAKIRAEMIGAGDSTKLAGVDAGANTGTPTPGAPIIDKLNPVSTMQIAKAIGPSNQK